nr:hypothetical protein [Tanacetum cinerariifolium]
RDPDPARRPVQRPGACTDRQYGRAGPQSTGLDWTLRSAGSSVPALLSLPWGQRRRHCRRYVAGAVSARRHPGNVYLGADVLSDPHQLD